MKKEKKRLNQKNVVIVLLVLAAASLLALFLRGEITGLTIAKTSEAEDAKLEIKVNSLEVATYNDYDFDAKDWLDKEYFRIWVKVFNPGDVTKTFDSIKLIDNFGNQYAPYESIANRISKTERIFGNYLEVSPHTIREGYLAFPKLDTRNVRLVFVVDGKTNAFQLR